LDIQVTTIVNGRWRQNCYIVSTLEGDALIIDPGSAAADITATVELNHWRPLAILNTHAHYDHVGAVADLMDRYRAPFYLHGADERLLSRANLYRMLFESREPIRVPAITHDISTLPPVFGVGPFSVTWLATPGHTDGSVCLLVDGILFSGDTLMRGTVGRTDLPGGNSKRLLESLRMLADLPQDIVVCGGHGPRTTLAAELAAGAPVANLLR
jgi:glyoxylase-like metal-dependent hydrolase (beta-lactamase superfamily II)